MRFAYVGLPLGALALMRAGVRLVSVCIGHPRAPGMRRLRRTLPSDVPLLGRPDLADPTVERALLARKPDALLSFFWPKLVPGTLIEALPRGAFGVHPSLLPRHRGPDPFFWTVLEGDAETGVTLHRLDASYDTGAIVDVRRVAVQPAWNAYQLARALDRPALELLISAAERLTRGEALEGEPQPTEGASEAPLPSPDDLSIDWNEPMARVLRRVRAGAPAPGCVAALGEETVVVLRARPGEGPKNFLPAEAFVSNGAVHVRAGDGFVELIEVRDLDDAPVDPAALLRDEAQSV